MLSANNNEFAVRLAAQHIEVWSLFEQYPWKGFAPLLPTPRGKPHTTGLFAQFFPTFTVGLDKMAAISFSVVDSLQNHICGYQKPESYTEFVKKLQFNEERANGAWVYLKMDICGGAVSYATSNGRGYGCYPIAGGWVFWLRHHDGRWIDPSSSLRHSALRAGWYEVLESGHLASGEEPEPEEVPTWIPGLRTWEKIEA